MLTFFISYLIYFITFNAIQAAFNYRWLKSKTFLKARRAEEQQLRHTIRRCKAENKGDFVLLSNNDTIVSNALEELHNFTGGGFYVKSHKTIYLTSMAVASLQPRTVEALLAHEMGHKKYDRSPFSFCSIDMVLKEIRADRNAVKEGYGKEMIQYILQVIKSHLAVIKSSLAVRSTSVFLNLYRAFVRIESLFITFTPRLMALMVGVIAK